MQTKKALLARRFHWSVLLLFDGFVAPSASLMPVDPKPPAPRCVASRSLVSTTSGVTICSRINCATRSPRLTIDSTLEENEHRVIGIAATKHTLKIRRWEIEQNYAHGASVVGIDDTSTNVDEILHRQSWSRSYTKQEVSNWSTKPKRPTAEQKNVVIPTRP